MVELGFNPALVGFTLASLGYAIGLAMHKLPLPGEGRAWGGTLISYSLLTAAFLAIAGSGDALVGLANSVSKSVAGQARFPEVQVSQLPFDYFKLGMNAMFILSIMAGSAAGAALIPIVGPALAGVLSVFSTLPSMALAGTMILSFIIAVAMMIFVTFAPVMIPIGIVLLSAPAGKLKGVGGWLIAMALALSAVGPLIPGIGLTACEQFGCSYQEMVTSMDAGKLGWGAVEGLIAWMFNLENSIIMKMWSFTLGSMIGFSILSLTAAALSRAIGGVAASLGIG